MTDLLAALALAIVIEGLLYAAFPDPMKKMLASINRCQHQAFVRLRWLARLPDFSSCGSSAAE